MTAAGGEAGADRTMLVWDLFPATDVLEPIGGNCCTRRGGGWLWGLAADAAWIHPAQPPA